MRSVLLSVAVLIVFPHAIDARPRGGGSGGGGGGSGGGGRLSQVAGGIHQASEGSNRGSSGGVVVTRPSAGELYIQEDHGHEIWYLTNDGTRTLVRRRPAVSTGAGITANLDGFIGIQKVYESDGAGQLRLAVDDGRFRLSGSVSRYTERLPMGGRLSLTLPTGALGMRISDAGPTRAYAEVGVAHSKTSNDPMGSSSLTAPMMGVHVEHRLGSTTVIGDAHAMVFRDGIRAYAGRLAMRRSHIELGIRVLDFNVGPALFGPELGLAF